jgi:hypothetical protein
MPSLAVGQHIGANRHGGFDCKMVNEVQMQRVRGVAGVLI